MQFQLNLISKTTKNNHAYIRTMHIVNRGISIAPRTMCIVRKNIQFSQREITGKNPSLIRMGLMIQGIKRRRMDKDEKTWAVECEVQGQWVELTRKWGELTRIQRKVIRREVRQHINTLTKYLSVIPDDYAGDSAQNQLDNIWDKFDEWCPLDTSE